MCHLPYARMVASTPDAAAVQRSAQGAAEGRHINKSLLALGTVIARLSQGGAGHICFRDSVLTRLLQASLTGKPPAKCMHT